MSIVSGQSCFHMPYQKIKCRSIIELYLKNGQIAKWTEKLCKKHDGLSEYLNVNIHSSPFPIGTVKAIWSNKASYTDINDLALISQYETFAMNLCVCLHIQTYMHTYIETNSFEWSSSLLLEARRDKECLCPMASTWYATKYFVRSYPPTCRLLNKALLRIPYSRNTRLQSMWRPCFVFFILKPCMSVYVSAKKKGLISPLDVADTKGGLRSESDTWWDLLFQRSDLSRLVLIVWDTCMWHRKLITCPFTRQRRDVIGH